MVETRKKKWKSGLGGMVLSYDQMLINFQSRFKKILVLHVKIINAKVQVYEHKADDILICLFVILIFRIESFAFWIGN